MLLSLIFLLTLQLTACGGGGGNNNSSLTEPANNWDEMKWDQGKWE